MKIAITGITGFLGYYVAKRLFSKDVQMYALTRSGSSTLHLHDFKEKITFVQGNLDDPETLKKLVHDAEIVIHMAYERNGASFHEAANKDIIKFVKTNLLGSIELLESSKRAGIKQFIFISSCAVYGTIMPNIKLDEFHPLMPDSKYGAYKASVEAFCHSFFLAKNFATTIFRPVGIYGLHPHLAHSAWYNIVKDIKQGNDIEVTGGGKIVHVEDVVHAIELSIGNTEASGKVYNLIDFYTDNLTIAEMAKELCSSRSKINGTPKQAIHTIDKSHSLALGVKYAGIEGLRQYVQELMNQI